MSAMDRKSKILALSKEKARFKAADTKTEKNRKGFITAMDKCQKFINKWRSPSQLRKMDEKEIEGVGSIYNDDGDDEVIDPADRSTNTNLSTCVSDYRQGDGTENRNKTKSGVLSFGSLGFCSFENQESVHAHENSDNSCSADDAADEVVENLDENLNHERSVDRQVENESTPLTKSPQPKVIGHQVSNRRLFGSPVAAKKKKNWPTTYRKEFVNTMKNNQPKEKTKVAVKKAFKNNVLTVKFKISGIQAKAGKSPDFALFIKDDVHEINSKNTARHAGKYISYVKGDIQQKFYSKQGISYDPKIFYVCDNEIDFEEDKRPVYLHEKSVNMEITETCQPQVSCVSEKEDSVDDVESLTRMSSSDSRSEKSFNIYNMKKTARRVSWGAPSFEHSDDSFSSGGVHVYGRGAEKSIDSRKKAKRSKDKIRCKESMERTSSDLLRTVRSQQKRSRGKGRGGRGRLIK